MRPTRRATASTGYASCDWSTSTPSTPERAATSTCRLLQGINLEPYNGSADPRSRTIRITDNHRGIVLDVGDGEHFVLTRVCTHDEAERWMANNTFKINATTNALELMDTTAIEAEAAVVQEQADPTGERLFAHRRERDLPAWG